LNLVSPQSIFSPGLTRGRSGYSQQVRSIRPLIPKVQSPACKFAFYQAANAQSTDVIHSLTSINFIEANGFP
jgi:hypothetical protein